MRRRWKARTEPVSKASHRCNNRNSSSSHHGAFLNGSHVVRVQVRRRVSSR